MQTLKYTSRIITLISSGDKLNAIKMARDLYGISLPEAKKMIVSYKQGDSYYTPMEATHTNVLSSSSNTPVDNSSSHILPLACPNCGSTHVHKSVGGKLEHAAAWGGTKLLKSVLLGDYGGFTGGAENEIIKEDVPFQQVCDYCHSTFHASKSNLDSGKYSMSKSKADQLTNAYNRKLQKVKDKEVADTKSRASKERNNTFIGAGIFLFGLLICNTCEHTTEGIFGLTTFTWSFMFSCVIMFVGGIISVIAGFTSYSTYEEASQIEKMPLTQYAKDHRA